jgi:hypothetical protein
MSRSDRLAKLENALGRRGDADNLCARCSAHQLSSAASQARDLASSSCADSFGT